jgi:2-hydroxy-3-oxopropionate reductase
MGKNITLVGGNGDGQTTKVANQIIVALNIEAVGEALVFASKAGADPAKVRQALMGGFAASRILEVHGERMIKRTFNPGFRIELHQKDLNLALQERARAGRVAAQHRHRAGAVSSPMAAGLGSFGDGPGAGEARPGPAWVEIGKARELKTVPPPLAARDVRRRDRLGAAVARVIAPHLPARPGSAAAG